MSLKPRVTRSIFVVALLAVIALMVVFIDFSASDLPVSADSPPDTDVVNYSSFATDTIYQIVTDRFFDGNSSNNPTGDIFNPGDNKKYHGGDWAGIADKMPYLKGMGITAIWISSPVQNLGVLDPSNNDAAYHGYWGHDFFVPNQYFGSISDFQNLINVAHDNEIKVVIDFAPNHTSTADYPPYTFPEDGALYKNGTLLGQLHNDPSGIFNHESWTDFSTWENSVYHSLYGLSDLNQMNSEIDAYLKDSINMWLDLGVDGIRVDAVKHMPMGWQKNWVNSVYNHKSVFMYGEWFNGGTGSDGEMNEFANGSGMSLLDFRFANAVRNAVGNLSGTMEDLHNTILSTASDFKQVNNQVTFIDNHDMSRFMTLSNNTAHSVDTAYVLLLTQRGVPAIYYGSEQYSTGSGDPDNRADMPSFNTTSNAYQVISKLAPLRKSNPALAYGTYLQRWLNNDVYVYERQFGDSVVLTAVNRNSSQGYNITDLLTNLPAGTYSDSIGGLLGGSSLTVYSGGSVPQYYIGPGVSAVWEYTATGYGTPIIGSVDPLMANPGVEITITGRGFGSGTGTVKFGAANATVVDWSDTKVMVTVPSIAAGEYDITVTNASNVSSSSYPGFVVLSNSQVAVRFIVRNATTATGENVYLVGSVDEIGNWDASKAIGPFFNATASIATYPDWFYDVSVPAGTAIQYKFVKIDGSGNVVWESGANHTYTTPSANTGQADVTWQTQ